MKDTYISVYGLNVSIFLSTFGLQEKMDYTDTTFLISHTRLNNNFTRYDHFSIVNRSLLAFFCMINRSGLLLNITLTINIISSLLCSLCQAK